MNIYDFMSIPERIKECAFRARHYKKCKSNIHYIIYPTGLGEAIYVKCDKCKKKENITDYGCW